LDQCSREISAHWLVYTGNMKSITFSADANLIERARQRARKRQTTLNEAFREWLREYAEPKDFSRRYEDVMARLRHIKMEAPVSRDELNERR
jgi:hypothetical protein